MEFGQVLLWHSPADRVQRPTLSTFYPLPSPFTSGHDLGACLPLPGGTMCLPLRDGCPTVPGATISNGGLLWVSPLVPVREKRKHYKRGWALFGQHVTGVQTQLRNTMLPRLAVGTGNVSENCQVTVKKPPSTSAAVPASPALNNPCKQKSALPAQPQMGLPFGWGWRRVFQK